MLARKFSLTDSKDFKKVKDEGKVVSSDTFYLGIYNRGDAEVSRFGFVVSTNISKNASQRVRIKRALSEGTRIVGYKIKEGYDVVFVAKQTSAKKLTAELMREVSVALVTAGLKQ
jgi:ribonuclease P protein component